MSRYRNYFLHGSWGFGGGRLGYCLLYDWAETIRNPVSIIAFGMGVFEEWPVMAESWELS